MMHRHPPAAAPGALGKLAALVGGALLVVAGLMFSVVLLAVFVVAGLAAWGYVWWRTRALRRAMRERPPGGHVIDGEAVVVDDPERDPGATLPRDPPRTSAGP